MKNMKDKVCYISLVGLAIAIIAFGVCFGLGKCDYVGLIACCIAFVGLLYAYYQDKRHEKMNKLKEQKALEDKTNESKTEEA